MERIDELKPLYDSLLSKFTNEEWNCYCTFFIQKGKEFDFSVVSRVFRKNSLFQHQI